MKELATQRITSIPASPGFKVNHSVSFVVSSPVKNVLLGLACPCILPPKYVGHGALAPFLPRSCATPSRVAAVGLVRWVPPEKTPMPFQGPSSRWFRLAVLVCFANPVPVMAEQPKHAELFNLVINAGMIANYHPQPWPSVPFSGIRLWDSRTAWLNLNPAQSEYDWSSLDAWLALAGAGNNSVLYTFGGVPQWASSNPHDRICNFGPGACDPPKDLNADGSGPDQLWKDFVTALVDHNAYGSGAHIRYWEMWNEPHNVSDWKGTYAQLVRMVGDAYAIIKAADPDSVILSVTVGWQSKSSMQWFSGYVNAGGGQYIDKISCHGYSKENRGYGPPEDMVRYLAPYRAGLQALGLGNKEIWDTEANWGRGLLSNSNLQAAWLARFYLLHISEGIPRQYWFMWNSGGTGLWLQDAADHSLPGKLRKAGIAFHELNKWVVGATMSQHCSNRRSIWTCTFTRNGGYQALAVWDTADTCAQNQCQTTNYHFQGNYLNYLTLDGAEFNITGDTVPIGAQPILLQNKANISR